MALAGIGPQPIGPALLVAGAVVAAALAVTAALSPAVAAGLLIAVIVSNTSGVIGSVAGLSAYIVASGIAAVALVIGVRRGTVRLRGSPLFLLAVVFLVTRGVSLFAAHDVAAGKAELSSEVKDAVALFLLVPLVHAARRLWLLVAVAVGVVAALAGLTVVQQFLLHNTVEFGGFAKVPLGRDVGALTPRHSGPFDDVNFWARVIVLFSPLALSCAVSLPRRAGRAAAVVAAGALAAGCYLTQSRGGLLALALAAATWVFMTSLPLRGKLAVLSVGVLALLVVPGAGSRLGTLDQLTGSASSATDVSLSDRAAVQRVSIAMAKDHPLLGVGVGNYASEVTTYRRAYAPQLTTDLAPHNLYLQMLAESGVLGLVGWLSFYVGTVWVATRAWVRARAHPGAAVAPVAAGVVAGLVGWALASLFLHLSDLRVLMVVVALAAVADLLSRELPPPPPRMTRLAGARRAPVRVTTALLVLGVAFTALWARDVIGTRAGWTATMDVVLEPTSKASDTPYVRDVVSRPEIMGTMTEIARSAASTTAGTRPAARSRVRVTATAVPDTAVVRFSAAGRDPAVVASAVDRARQAFAHDLAIGRALYGAPAVPGVSAHVAGHGQEDAAVPLTRMLSSLAFLLALIVVHVRRRRHLPAHAALRARTR